MNNGIGIKWTQGKCCEDAFFISNNEVCFRTGSFIKICSTDEFSEISIQGPSTAIECISTDSDSHLIAIKSQYIYILDYPGFNVLSQWNVFELSNVMQMCFAGNCYLLTVEGSPDFGVTLWNWEKSLKLKRFYQTASVDDASTFYMSVHPGFNNILVYQQLSNFHFFEIEDIMEKVELRRKSIFLPVMGDDTGDSFLDDKKINSLTYFDKMRHGTWGLHSESMHKFPLKVFCSHLSEYDFVLFYDYLMKLNRLQASCHCWLPGTRLLVACFDGTVLSVTLDFSITFHHTPCSEQYDDKNYITGMVLNKNGLYIAEKNGDISFINDIDNWMLIKLVSMQDESPTRMKISPDFKSILIVNFSNSVVFLEMNENKADVAYLSLFQDDCRIVGIFAINSSYCITARNSGLIEVWDLHSGALLSDYAVKDSIKLIEGCLSSSLLLISGNSSLLYMIDFSDVWQLKCVQILKPCVSTIEIIKCEPFGRFAAFISSDSFIFIYSMLPSRGFEILGYLSISYKIIDAAVFRKNVEDNLYLTLLTKGETTEHILNMQIPEDFDISFLKYWEDNSGIISHKSVKLVDINLNTKCCSLVVHYLKGIIMYLPIENKFINVPLESVEEFNFKPTKEVNEVSNDNPDNRLFLPLSHSFLLVTNERGDICIMSVEDFHTMAAYKLSNYTYSKFSCAIVDDLILLEGCKGVLTCLNFKDFPKVQKMPWELFCEKKRDEESKALSSMQPLGETESQSWVEQQLNIFYAPKISELKEKRSKLEENFIAIKRNLDILAHENCSVPLEYQLKTENFIFDENKRDELDEIRTEEIEKIKLEMKGKTLKIQNDIQFIKDECLDNMHVKGKILTSLKGGNPLYNYSIPVFSTKEKNEILRVNKINSLEKCLRKVKLKETVNLEDFVKDLPFDAFSESESKEDIEKVFKLPFHLQSRSERIDYISSLKYVIFRKRQAFNSRFNEVEQLRKSTLEKIHENNKRVKEILQLIGEDKDVWEPDEASEMILFKVDDEAVEKINRTAMENNFNEPKGLAEDFLSDDWLLKLKKSLVRKYKTRLKKDSIEMLRKEMEKKLKVVNELVDQYEEMHGKVVEEKLQWDLEIGQDELQIFLILYSAANFSIHKKWEICTKRYIESLESECKSKDSQISQLDSSISVFKRQLEQLQNKSASLDSEVLEMSKISRNKQALLDSYEKRPTIVLKENLDPYNTCKKVTEISEDLFVELNSSKNKPQKIPLSLWKEFCALREQKSDLEKKINEVNCKIKIFMTHKEKLVGIQRDFNRNIKEITADLHKMHSIRIRCNYETPMVLPILHNQLEIHYPEELNFKEAFFLRKYHVESLNSMLSNAGSDKLQAVEQISKAKYQIEKNEAKVRINKLKVREAIKEIELAKCIPISKEVQKALLDSKSFNLLDKVDALEKSSQLEMGEFKRQMNQISQRISNIEDKKGILRKSMKEKKKEIGKLKGDITELRKIESLKSNSKGND